MGMRSGIQPVGSRGRATVPDKSTVRRAGSANRPDPFHPVDNRRRLPILRPRAKVAARPEELPNDSPSHSRAMRYLRKLPHDACGCPVARLGGFRKRRHHSDLAACKVANGFPVFVDEAYRPVQKSCQRNWPSTWSAHSLSANLLVWNSQIYLDSPVLLIPRRLRFESTSSCVSSPARSLHPLPVAFRSQPARSTAGLSGSFSADSTT